MNQLNLDRVTYETYKEIMDELSSPIQSHDLDVSTLKRLYESKLVYLENLRDKIFMLLNDDVKKTPFTWSDYEFIIKAKEATGEHLRAAVLVAITDSLSKKSA